MDKLVLSRFMSKSRLQGLSLCDDKIKSIRLRATSDSIQTPLGHSSHNNENSNYFILMREKETATHFADSSLDTGRIFQHGPATYHHR